MSDLTRFKTAQSSSDSGYEVALRELRAGRKRSHWIWYVFPQIAGLGSSSMATHFGVRGRGEAEAYLRDETLRTRLREAIVAVAAHVSADPAAPLQQVMGSDIDALKLVSSLTLFEAVAADLSRREPGTAYADLAEQARAVLDVAAAEGYGRCRFTLQQLVREMGPET